MGWAFRIAAWGIAVLLLRESLARPEGVLRIASDALAWLVGHRLLAEANAVLSFLIALRVFVWCVSVFDAEGAKRIDPFPKLISLLSKSFSRGIAFLWHLLLLVVEGKAPPKPKRKASRKEEV